MGSFAIGDVVLVEFPYSDYLNFKKRPALIIGLADFDNYILCQITSKKFPSRWAVSLAKSDFEQASLQLDSYIRPDKIYTVEALIIDRLVGKLRAEKMTEVRRSLVQLFELT